MFFNIKNKHYLSTEQLRTDTLLSAYYIIKNYPMYGADLLMDNYLQQQYKMTLKDMCIKLLLNLTFYKNDEGNFILIFKDPEQDKLARLITYGNGMIPGSRILRCAIKN